MPANIFDAAHQRQKREKDPLDTKAQLRVADSVRFA